MRKACILVNYYHSYWVSRSRINTESKYIRIKSVMEISISIIIWETLISRENKMHDDSCCCFQTLYRLTWKWALCGIWIWGIFFIMPVSSFPAPFRPGYLCKYTIPHHTTHNTPEAKRPHFSPLTIGGESCLSLFPSPAPSQGIVFFTPCSQEVAYLMPF